MTVSLTFGQWLKDRRATLDLTQETLAERVGCAVETVRKLERDLRRPSRAMLVRFLEELEVPASEHPELSRLARMTGAVPTAAGAPPDRWPGNLHLPRSPLHGRDGELSALCQLLRQPSVALVTVTGPGGAGKTRLSLAAATALQPEFADGVFWVDLTPAGDWRLVPALIAGALALPETEEGDPAARLRAWLRYRNVLLVLDNCEHLLPAAPELASLLAACPGLKVLATSRERLRLSGEHEYPLLPLATPAVGAHQPPEALLRYGAVALLVERAAAARPGFTLTPENATAVADICAQLEGLPLALELAAAQVKYFAPTALRQRLADPLSVLVRGPGDVPSRQQGLQATLDWSYQLLTESEQWALRALSVFAGGCTLPAAERLFATLPGSQASVAESLLSLVDKSLLQVADATTEAPRFSMLGTVRAYAARRLAEAGEGATVAAAFVNHVLAMVEGAEPRLAGAGRAQELAALEEEAGNVRAALGLALAVPEAATALRLAAGLGTFWLIGGRLAEGRQWLDAALRHGGDAATGARARALAAAAAVATRQGDYPAVQAYTLERLDLCRKLGNAGGVADATRVLGDLAMEDLAFDEAETRYRDSLALYLETGDAGGQASVLNNMGELARYRGDYPAAAHRYGESLDLCRRTADESGEARALINLGWTRLHEGDPPGASDLFFGSLAIQQRLGGSLHRIAACLMGLAAGAAAAGETERAALLFGATDAILESIGASMDGVDKLEYARYVGVLEAQMGAQALAETTGRGAALTVEDAVALAWHGTVPHL